MIPGSVTPLLLKKAAVDTGDRSLRFNSSDSAYLGATFGTPTDQDVFTLSMWVKRSALGSTQHLFGVSTNHSFGFTSGDALNLTFGGSSALTTTALFRDPSAFYHILWVQNGTAHTLYVNDASVGTATATSNTFNTAVAHQIGAGNTANFFNGYLADIHFIDGQALDPTSFAEVDATTGQLVPIEYTGTYGTNGFWLKFSNNSAATATTLGKDYSGNSNNWTPNNLSVTAGAGNDSLVDTPTSYGTDTGAGGEVRGNYCTWNPVGSGSGAVLTNGNLDYSLSGAATINRQCRGTILIPTSGKWYWECTVTTVGESSIGVVDFQTGSGSYYYRYDVGGFQNIYINDSQTAAVAGYTNNDVIGIGYDADNQQIRWYKNGSQVGTNYSLTNTGRLVPYALHASGSSSCAGSTNFGQRPFAYPAPSGFKALCDTNLPAPVVAKPSTVFDVITYTGTGANATIPNVNTVPTSIAFTPDLVWLKGRSGATDHALYDVVRGVQKDLVSNSTAAETTQTTGLTAFGTNTFDIGTLAKLNTNTSTYVAWCWDESATAGVDIVSTTSDGSGNVVYTHNLGVTPAFIISRRRNAAADWNCWHQAFTQNDYIVLNSTSAKQTFSGLWSINSSSATITAQASSATYIAYLFAPVAGYSSFGSYTASNSSDGPFVYTGFKPRFILIKNASDTTYTNNYSWALIDTQRSPYNSNPGSLNPLWANRSYQENLYGSGVAVAAQLGLDILSNGFKLRCANAELNFGTTYIYAAFAESPFQYARAR